MERTDHATHDLDVLAAAADRGVEDATRIAAERQVAECQDCAALFADLRLISTGLAALPKELAVSRDFRISPERAAKLRRAGWRGVVQGLFGSGPSLRPFASALTTLGVAGLLLTVALPSVGGFLSFGAATGAAPELNAGGQPASTSGGLVGQSGGGKSYDSASPVLAPGGPPAGAAASPATDRGLHGSPGPYASNREYELNSSASAAPYPAPTGTDGVAAPTTDLGTPAAPFPTLGVLAAVSLGVLLLGLFLLFRSRARPFDSVG
jgi:hypothetical protein